MNIINIKITDIHRPYEKNPRHNEDAVEAELDAVHVAFAI